MFATSVTEDAWARAAAASPGPWLFVAEAVLLYLPAEQAAGVLGRIRDGFPGSELIMDSFTSSGLAAIAGHDTLPLMSAGPRWALDDAQADLAAWGPTITVLQECRVTDPPGPVRERMPAAVRDTLAAVDSAPDSDQYRLYRLRIG